MPTNDTLTKQPETTHPDPRAETKAIPDSPGSSRPQRPIDDSPARAGVAFAIAAAVGVGALVWAVIAGPTDTAVDPSTHDRVEQNRANTLRDLATQPTGSHDRVELNRANTLRDLATQPTGSHDRVELNRTNTLATSPRSPPVPTTASS